MLLSDRDLRQAIHDRRLIIDPFEPELIQPASIDLRLDRHFLLWPPVHHGWFELNSFVDPAQEQHMLPCDIPDGLAFELQPGHSVLASTVETITLDRTLAARVEGKSSIGRLSLATHITAGFIDPGFSGQITLELVNHNPRPILLHPGMLIGQLCVLPMLTPADQPYGSGATGSRYNGQRGPTPSRSWQNWRTWPLRDAA
ncbi:dCTP deaminase [Micromonospora maritima]|uniref:dCTP deaminase n=1 Tax=Micromonospora maritima TaxID=986711 RepID=UPI00157DAA64|nr:dCTP deaminase [Micromonospora maritima]